MNRGLIMKLIIILALAAVLMVGVQMYNGKAAKLPSVPSGD